MISDGAVKNLLHSYGIVMKSIVVYGTIAVQCIVLLTSSGQ
jgi:hypothetical protein